MFVYHEYTYPAESTKAYSPKAHTQGLKSVLILIPIAIAIAIAIAIGRASCQEIHDVAAEGNYRVVI